MTKKRKEAVLSDEQIQKLSSLATYDGVAIAEEIRESYERLLHDHPFDDDFRRKLHEAAGKAIKALEKVERGQEVIEVLAPIFEATRPR